MSDVLLEEVNPNGNLQVMVEADDQVCYLYLNGAPDLQFGVRALWLRNHVPAPAQLDVERMKAGSPPRNPAAHCRHPQGQPRLHSENLRCVWLPEGNGVALYEQDDLLAIIPPWSGVKGFDGYARDAVGEGPLAWALEPDNVQVSRFAEAQAYWKQWDDPELWPRIQDELITPVEAVLGKHSNYYAIDGGNWPPKAILRIPRPGGTALVTIGVSSRPQPNVEMSTDEHEQLRRIEMGAILPTNWPDEAVKRFASYLSAQSNLPWTHYTWLGPRHTIPCDSWLNPEFPCALLTHEHAAVPRISLGTQFGDPVNILWFLPITAAERETAMNRGSAAVGALPSNRWTQS